MMPIRGQNNVQGSSDMGAIPFAFTDYRRVDDPAVRAEYAAAWGIPVERLSATVGRKVTEIVGASSPVRGLYIMGENPIISDPDVAHAEDWFLELEFLAVQDLFLTESARCADVARPNDVRHLMILAGGEQMGPLRGLYAGWPQLEPADLGDVDILFYHVRPARPAP